MHDTYKPPFTFLTTLPLRRSNSTFFPFHLRAHSCDIHPHNAPLSPSLSLRDRRICENSESPSIELQSTFRVSTTVRSGSHRMFNSLSRVNGRSDGVLSSSVEMHLHETWRHSLLHFRCLFFMLVLFNLHCRVDEIRDYLFARLSRSSPTLLSPSCLTHQACT